MELGYQVARTNPAPGLFFLKSRKGNHRTNEDFYYQPYSHITSHPAIPFPFKHAKLQECPLSLLLSLYSYHLRLPLELSQSLSLKLSAGLSLPPLLTIDTFTCHRRLQHANLLSPSSCRLLPAPSTCRLCDFLFFKIFFIEKNILYNG